MSCVSACRHLATSKERDLERERLPVHRRAAGADAAPCAAISLRHHEGNIDDGAKVPLRSTQWRVPGAGSLRTNDSVPSLESG